MVKSKIRNKKDISKSIITGLTEALEFTKNLDRATLRTKNNFALKPVPNYKSNDIKKIRKKLFLTQKTFAKALGVSIKTVESWESNTNIPSGPAQRFLYLLNKKPQLLEEIKS
ncbi:MAG: type II toxin-antitoxin system MqsA family antitoxin [Ignavibacteria bacterium]|nr:type II toxin-antitoxin system MqsA family antitoxin [Ignavibacteria bacterium]